MSIEAVAWALAQQVPHSSAKFVLVVMANHANRSNGVDFTAWPSISYLVRATSQDRKTVVENIKRLRSMGYLEDTGERVGSTKSIIVYRLSSPEIGTASDSDEPGIDAVNRPGSSTENGIAEQSQERDGSETEAVPIFPGSSTVFPGKQSQISPEAVPIFPGSSTENGTQNRNGTVKEPLKEPLRNRRRAGAREPVALPDWLPSEVWQMWDRYRRSLNPRSWTPDAMALSIRSLTKFREQGFSPQAVIEKAIEKGWRGLYAPSDEQRQAKHTGFQERTYVGTDPAKIDWA